jgi:MoxR-like ATPase
MSPSPSPATASPPSPSMADTGSTAPAPRSAPPTDSTRGRSKTPAEEVLQGLYDALGPEVIGSGPTVRLLAVALLSDGHVLLEGVPGVAKTLLVRRFAERLDLSFKRIQFTPDMLPSDIVGTIVLNPSSQRFEYRPGPIFANVILADEINRAPPKVQSALLEAMQERQVTVEGVTYPLPQPFIVIATQNPIEQEGTYPLPEAELDRLLFRVLIGYPTAEEELEILRRHAGPVAPPPATAGLTADVINRLRAQVPNVHASEDVLRYTAELVRRTREDARILLGASPRAGVQFLRAGKAAALLAGRDFVSPTDVKELAFSILNHRVTLHPEVVAQQYATGHLGVEPVLREILEGRVAKTTVPR